MAEDFSFQDEIDRIYRSESRRVFASLVRLLRDFDLAEEALHESFAAAIANWPNDGIPTNPRAWLVSTGRFKGIDLLRKRARLDSAHLELSARADQLASANANKVDEAIEDDRLRLIFICCHPAIERSVQIALTLREVCELSTDEIAKAFLVPTATMAQRIVRGKSKIRLAGIPFSMPQGDELTERIEAALTVVYLVFNEGYSASAGEEMIRADLTQEAIRLGRLLVELFPAPECMGLLALMLFQESRRGARTDAAGDLVLLEDQDRSLWNQELIREAQTWVERSVNSRRFGTYTLQAALAAEHAQAPNADATQWSRIVRIYDALLAIHPSPIIELNRAVAVAMEQGAEAGLALVDQLTSRGELVHYHLVHAVRADLLRRLDRRTEAIAEYDRALRLTNQAAEQRFLTRRRDSLV